MWRRVVVVLMCSSASCFSYDSICHELPCETPTPCEGRCAPYVGGGWEPVLVSQAAAGSPPHCPDVAPFEAMSSSSPPITACGVQEAPGACGAGYVCLPDEPQWLACIVRDGEHTCPSLYPDVVELPGEPVTLCCPGEEIPA